MTIRHTPLMLLLDGYKIDHRRQYPAHTEFVYTNGTYRSSRVPGQNEVVNFGVQGFCQKFFEEHAQDTFFNRPKDAVLAEYAEFLNNYLGPNDIGVDHIAALHDLGYLPLEVCSLPEGTLVPLRIPAFTIENTHPEFFWLTNYFETLMSNQIWLTSTSATTAYRYRRLIQAMTDLQGTDRSFVNWQGHDFSMRGMGGIDAAELSGAGHLLSFTGTDTVPAIEYVNRYYPGNGFVGGSVAATEHSVMCAGGKESERETFLRLLKLYPQGILSIVSDTWDFWGVIEYLLPSIRKEILGSDRKTVIRPDSGDPVKIICGDPNAPVGSVQFKGAVEALWDIFGGTETAQGYRVLDSHVGVIYGDSITEERCRAILEGLAAKGFAAANVVFGIGSYTYQYVTRDTYGFAMKATWVQIDGEEHLIQKSPKTDSGVKNSALGRIVVQRDSQSGRLVMIDGLTKKEQAEHDSLLRPIWRDGEALVYESFDEIRHRLHPDVF